MATPYDEWARKNFGQWFSEHFLGGGAGAPGEMSPIATSQDDFLAKRNWYAAQSEFGHRYPNDLNFPSTSNVGGPSLYADKTAAAPGGVAQHGFRHPNRYGVGATFADDLAGDIFRDQRQATRSYKGKMGMLAKGWNPETIKKAYGAPERPPWPSPKGHPDLMANKGGTANRFARFTAYPRMSSVNQLSVAQANKLGMAKEWKKMLNMPKWALAGQLSSFVSKWGKPALKLITKLPK